MKKARQDLSNPISLSSKRHSFHQDKIITPQKLEWNSPLQTVDSNNNKTFFTTMKAELSNIKSDFERLIQREDKSGVLGIKQKELIEQKNGWSTGEKVKSYSSYKQEERYMTQKKSEPDAFDLIIKNKDGTELGGKGFNLTKNINEAVNFKNKHINNREKEAYSTNNPVIKYISLEPKQEEVKETNYTSLNPKKYSTNYNEPSNEKEFLLQKIQNQKQKELCSKLEQEIANYKEESSRSKAHASKLQEQNKKLKEKIDAVLMEMAQKQKEIKISADSLAKYKEMVSRLDQSSKVLSSKQKELSQLHQKINQERLSRDNESYHLNQKINELSFYNNNFYNDNAHLTEENHHLKEAINNLQKLIEDSKRIAHQSQIQSQRKMEHLQRSLKEYEKRELMLQKQIEKLCNQLSTKQANSEHLQKGQQEHEGQKVSLCSVNHAAMEEEVQNLRNDLNKQLEINSLILKKYKQEIEKLNIQSITKSLEETVERLTDQNSHLKNQCNALSSKIMELEEQNRAYCTEISLYEDRDRAGHASRSLSCTEWEEMTDKIEQLQSQNKQLIEERDYRQLLQDVSAQKEEFSIAFQIKEDYQNLLKIAKNQLEDIERLRFECEKMQIRLRVCEEDRHELRTQKIRLEEELKEAIAAQRTSDTSAILKKYDQMRVQLEKKEKQFRSMKQSMRQSLLRREESI